MTGFSIAFTSAYLWFFYRYNEARGIADANLDGYLEVILLGVPAVLLMAGSMWMGETEADKELHPKILIWTVGMALFFVVAIYMTLFVIKPRFDTGERALILLMSTGFGASSGVLMGILSIKSKQRARERNHSLELAQQKEKERDRLEHLNHYLRHEVLNEAQKINGFATIVSQRSDIDDEIVGYLDTVRHSSEEIAVFIESIRTILDASNYKPDLKSVDLCSVIETEAEQIHQAHPTVDIDIRHPEPVRVVAGDLLNRVFRNVFENAIEHNPGGVSIRVLVEVDSEWVTVTVRDDGGGISNADQESLFEAPASGDHGYGLYLTRNLVRIYNGQLTLAETGPEGTAFKILFMREKLDDNLDMSNQIESSRSKQRLRT